jgi:uncharacterized membrane protein
MAEAQGAHRRQLEQRGLEAEIEGMRASFAEARLGQVFAFCVSLSFIVCGTYAVAIGQPWAAAIGGWLDWEVS